MSASAAVCLSFDLVRTSVDLWQSDVYCVSNIEAGYALGNFCNHARSIISDLEGKPATCQTQFTTEKEEWTHESLTACLSSPPALFTSIGLMLAAWTLMRTSVAVLNVGIGNSESWYPDGFE